MILSAFLNAVLSAAASFFVFCYPLSKVLPRPATVAVAFVAAAGVAVAVYFLTAKKENSRRAEKNGKSAFNERMRALYICTDDEIQSLFSEIFHNMKICADISGRHMHLCGDKIVYAALLPEPMNANELVAICRGLDIKDKKVTIISSSFSDGATAMAEKMKIDLVGGEEFYSFLKSRSPLPEKKALIEKRSLKSVFSPLLFRTNGRRFLIYSIVIGLFSNFSFFPVYYVFVSAIFAIYGLIALFFGKKPTDSGGRKKLDELFEKPAEKNAA